MEFSQSKRLSEKIEKMLDGDVFDKHLQEEILEYTNSKETKLEPIDELYLQFAAAVNASKPAVNSEDQETGGRYLYIFNIGYRAQLVFASLMTPEMGAEVAQMYDQVMIINIDALLRLSVLHGILIGEVASQRFLFGQSDIMNVMMQTIHFPLIETQLEYMLEHTIFDYQVEKAAQLQAQLNRHVEGYKNAGLNMEEDKDVVRIKSLLEQAIDTDPQLDSLGFNSFVELITKTNYKLIEDTEVFEIVKAFGPIVSERNLPDAIRMSQRIFKEAVTLYNVEVSSDELENPIRILQNKTHLEQLNNEAPYMVNLLYLQSEILGAPLYLKHEMERSHPLIDETMFDYFSTNLLAILIYLVNDTFKKALNTNELN